MTIHPPRWPLNLVFAWINIINVFLLFQMKSQRGQHLSLVSAAILILSCFVANSGMYTILHLMKYFTLWVKNNLYKHFFFIMFLNQDIETWCNKYYKKLFMD